MSPSHYRRAGARALMTSVLLTAVFAAGAISGIYFYPQPAFETEDHGHDDHDEDHGDAHEEEEDHVALTEQAYANLELRMGVVSKGDYWKSILVPARVVEIPGRSDLSVSAPVTGVIEEVRILPGQSFDSDTRMFQIKLTDESLIDAQSKLLETLTRQEVIEKEIARLSPLIETGVVPGAKRRDLEYEQKQLKAQETTLLQELRKRGLPQPMIDQIFQDRELASTLTVFPPDFVGQQIDESTGEGESEDATSGFSVENLKVHPGQSVSRGDSLCTVAYHSKLYIEGTAFEDDLPVLGRIAERHWTIGVETHGESQEQVDPLSLKLLRIDNHVDEATQTVRFFIELPNEVTATRMSEGREFQQWRFRPGQRLHLRLPVERWDDQLTLPVDAVVVDGPNVFVFAEHHHEEDEMLTSAEPPAPSDGANDEHEEHEEHEEHDVFIELEPIPVRLLHRDDKTVVIADDGQTPAGVPIALNNAQKLYLAMKMQAGGGGGHHHHHDH